MARLSDGAVGNTNCILRRIGDVSAPVTRIYGVRKVNRRLGELLQRDIDAVQTLAAPAGPTPGAEADCQRRRCA